MNDQHRHQSSHAERAARWIASVGGIGNLPAAPGTWGTLAGAAAAYPLTDLPLTGRLFVVAACLVVALWALHHLHAPQKTGDASWIVIDEVVGIWVVILPLGPMLVWWEWAVAIALFRVFDILKPPPARRLERSPSGARHGWPILLDDLVAAAWTLPVIIVLHTCL